MGFPERLLGDDEEVVLHMRTHWKALVLPVVVLVVTVGLASYAMAAMPASGYREWTRLAVLALAAVAVARWSVWPYLRWLTSTFTLTTHRLVTRSGVFARQGRDMPLARVNDVSFSHTFVERMLACGTVVVESAGERGQLVLTDVPRVGYVQRELYRVVEEDDERRRAGDQSA